MKRIVNIFLGILLAFTSCKKTAKQITAVSTKPQKIDVAEIKKERVAVLGIDVSHFQGVVDWEKVKKSGIQFCYAKATQGKYFKDPKFKENQLNTKKAGLKHGAYHFYVANDDPKLQATSFLSSIQDINEGDMLPMLDLEQGGITGKIDISQFQKDVIIWLNIVEKQLGVKPIIYTNNPFGKTYLDNSIFANYKLWLAEYGVKKPRIPNTWKDNGWAIWQRSEKGKVSGAIGNIDHDILNEKLTIEDIMYVKK